MNGVDDKTDCVVLHRAVDHTVGVVWSKTIGLPRALCRQVAVEDELVHRPGGCVVVDAVGGFLAVRDLLHDRVGPTATNDADQVNNGPSAGAPLDNNVHTTNPVRHGKSAGAEELAPLYFCLTGTTM